MTRIDPKCRQCNANMIEGFVLDHTQHSSYGQSKWLEGKPERSFWTGIKTKGRKLFVIAAYRCPQCGHLEQYATEPTTK